MAWVTLSLGSNLDAEINLTSCLDALLLSFNDLSLSSVFESESVGFDGDNFLNMVVGINTDLGLAELSVLLKEMEDKQGRDRSQPKFSGRTLDIDILTYENLTGEFNGIVLPRDEIIKNAFVLWPLSQINGKNKHPVLRQSYANLWADFDKEKQKLWPVNFEWHGRLISNK
ncbi:MAG: 2-amino-4-hydroxy-6-hydroxymethyldihydropteridine diphosphokinase [Gammaproteobacteria bacterium]|nr:2-amino-4-hydroxy-6-hydroxymethyldihydropteridine diphosphokinase [Gammaproteobacteria bacterium]MBT6041965.1 2-amino-4-hydroxy-6-hydroxymethyldihydropteridine diphosphokinase [Gammaproteobacteria bacterium]